MYKRLIILSLIIFAALAGMVVLGFFAVEKWAEGLEGKRKGQFAEVAEQVRSDVKRKLDDFIHAEENRPYTDYQVYYLPEDSFVSGYRQTTIMRSPLAGIMENDFAYGYFQIGPEGSITTPNDELAELRQKGGIKQDQIAQKGASQRDLFAENTSNINNVRQNVVPVLKRERLVNGKLIVDGQQFSEREAGIAGGAFVSSVSSPEPTSQKDISQSEEQSRQISYQTIESLQQQPRKAQMLKRSRAVADENILLNVAREQQDEEKLGDYGTPYTQAGATPDKKEQEAAARLLLENQPEQLKLGINAKTGVPEIQNEDSIRGKEEATEQPAQEKPDSTEADTVQIMIEPFVPVVVGGGDSAGSIFGGQVFYLRHIKIEDKHFLQGFKFQEQRLIEEITKSARQFMREGMDFVLSRRIEPQAAYTAVLDFGFGEIALNLMELIPGWIERDISKLYNWYFGTVGIVFIAVTFGLLSLWRNAKAQLKLAEKKDDFISAVSHELRTPLTSIRMYSEMLEKGWVKSDEKRTEYYKNMQQESERLSRLIENVLDFSRIQKKRKKYSFRLGDINECVVSVVEMMRPYAEQKGFRIVTRAGEAGQVSFDADAVTQIVVNLLDNAIKYAKDAEDKTILVSTYPKEGFVIIDVEDHGPGVPHKQRKKIFEEFYRIGSEDTRETAGAGLGLALVKKFAEAHNGFVEILNAKPTGSIFRVALAAKI
jgi:signal transduction histidine kinase